MPAEKKILKFAMFCNSRTRLLRCIGRSMSNGRPQLIFWG